MFIDSVELELSSGAGGAGCVSFHSEKFVIKGGPDGGDGGKGGDLFVVVDKNTHTLSNYRGRHHIKASNGRPGEGRKRYGKKGADAKIVVPPGTVVIDSSSGEVLLDLMRDQERVKLLEGGKGGLGNWHFRSSTNQKPTYAQPGLPGKSISVRLELKLIADVGLVGLPNVGKSTLISIVSNASPEIANYEFTTLTPKLGVVEVDEYNSFVMADIPGIISGASSGKGLGLQFLKHIERTGVLLFIIDVAHYKTPIEQYETLKDELKNFVVDLSSKEFAIALSRVDTLSEDETRCMVVEFLDYIDVKNSNNIYKFNSNLGNYTQDLQNYDKSKPFFIAPISSLSKLNINPMKYAILDILKEVKSEKSSS
jgi:GTP-binding protein